MPTTSQKRATAILQLLLLIATTGIFFYLIVYVKQLLPFSQVAEISAIVVAGEVLLVELLYFLGISRRRSKPHAVEKSEITEGLPKEARASSLTVNHIIIFFSVVTFDLFLLVPAYIVSLPALTQQAVFDIVGTLVTVQGFLLGLLGLSALQFTGQSRILKPLVAITLISILISVSTIMFGEASTLVPQSVLMGFFFASVTAFSAVVGIYSWFILESRASVESRKSIKP
jgi:hypothetical protein